MPENLQKAWGQFRSFWQNLPNSSRASLLGITLAILAVTAVFTYLSLRPRFSPLFSNLVPEDAGRIVAKLKDQGIPYRVSDDGKTVMVPRARVHELRLTLAAAGLPQGGGVGFELFDKAQWNITEFTQRVNYIRALQTELQRTINQLEPVDSSRVHIVLPEKTLFQEDQDRATASVVLRLKPYASLQQGQIQGIVHLVSHSVEGLKSENVEVIDAEGNVLSDRIREGGGLSDMTTAQARARKQFEKALERRIEGMLRKVVGASHVVARVSAELDFTRANIKSETYQPVVGEEGIVRSEQVTDENFQGKGVAPGGVPGVTSNVPTYPAAPTGQSQYKKSDAIRNYEVNKVVAQRVAAPGEVKRLSVAVVLDSPALKKISVKDIQNVVSAAAGIDPKRGDRVEVVGLPFSREAEKQQAKELAKERKRILLYWGVGLGTTLLMVVLFYLMLRPKKRVAEEFAPSEAIPLRTLAEKEAEELGLPEFETVPAGPVSEEKQRKKEAYNDVIKAVSERPGEVAQLIRGWITEE